MHGEVDIPRKIVLVDCQGVEGFEGRGTGLLPGGFALGQLNGTPNGTPMEPSISVDAENLTGKFLQLSGLLDGFEQWKKSCCNESDGPKCVTTRTPTITAIATTIEKTKRTQ